VVARRRGYHEVGSDERAGGAMKEDGLIEERAPPERYDVELAESAAERVVVDLELQLEIGIPPSRKDQP
jgi:hypothetical protein